MATHNAIGDAAEDAVISALLGKAWDVYQLQTTQNHGVDVIGVKDFKMRIIEVKANQSKKSNAQKFGGHDFAVDRIQVALNGEAVYKSGSGPWTGNGRLFKHTNHRPGAALAHIDFPLKHIAEKVRTYIESSSSFLSQEQIDELLEGKEITQKYKSSRQTIVKYYIVWADVDPGSLSIRSLIWDKW